jgi:sec-independent protein translocase protein TatB
MFDISWSELLIIGIVALIVIGPKELPGALRTLGQWMSKIRRMASEFQGQFQDAMREAELAELKKEMDDMAAKATNYGQFDPLEDVRREVEKATELPSIDELGKPATAADAPATPETTTAETTTETTSTEAALPPPVTQSEPSPEPTPAPSQPEPALADAKPESGRAPA